MSGNYLNYPTPKYWTVWAAPSWISADSHFHSQKHVSCVYPHTANAASFLAFPQPCLWVDGYGMMEEGFTAMSSAEAKSCLEAEMQRGGHVTHSLLHAGPATGRFSWALARSVTADDDGSQCCLQIVGFVIVKSVSAKRLLKKKKGHFSSPSSTSSLFPSPPF